MPYGVAVTGCVLAALHCDNIYLFGISIELVSTITHNPLLFLS